MNRNSSWKNVDLGKDVAWYQASMIRQERQQKEGKVCTPVTGGVLKQEIKIEL